MQLEQVEKMFKLLQEEYGDRIELPTKEVKRAIIMSTGYIEQMHVTRFFNSLSFAGIIEPCDRGFGWTKLREDIFEKLKFGIRRSM